MREIRCALDTLESGVRKCCVSTNLKCKLAAIMTVCGVNRCSKYFLLPCVLYGSSAKASPGVQNGIPVPYFLCRACKTFQSPCSTCGSEFIMMQAAVYISLPKPVMYRRHLQPDFSFCPHSSLGKECRCDVLQSTRYRGYSLSCDEQCCFSLFKFLEFKRED